MSFTFADERGFTLTEIMATVAVAALAASMALPAVSGAIADQQRAAAINELVGTLHLARNTAITRNATVTICASLDGERCTDSDWELGWIAFPDADLDRAPDNGELLTGGLTGSGVSLRSEEFRRYLSYRPTGQPMVDRPEQNSGEFIVCDRRGTDAARVIAVLPAGMPRLSEQRLNGEPPECRDD